MIYKAFPNVPPDIEIDFEGNSGFSELIKTIQGCLYAIEDEIQINCANVGWFENYQSAELYKIWQIVNNYLEETKKLNPGDLLPKITDDECESISHAMTLIWRLGTSLFALHDVERRQRETCRLITPDQFYKSEYVLFIARLFKLINFNVNFVRELMSTKTPDLVINNTVQIECKQRDSSYRINIRNVFNTARKQLAKDKPGIVCIDVPPNIDLGVSADVIEINRQVKGELNSTSRIHYCFVSQTKFIVTGVGEDKVGGLQFARRLYPHPYPEKLKMRVPDNFNLKNVFGKPWQWLQDG